MKTTTTKKIPDFNFNQTYEDKMSIFDVKNFNFPLNLLHRLFKLNNVLIVKSPYPKFNFDTMQLDETKGSSFITERSFHTSFNTWIKNNYKKSSLYFVYSAIVYDGYASFPEGSIHFNLCEIPSTVLKDKMDSCNARINFNKNFNVNNSLDEIRKYVSSTRFAKDLAYMQGRTISRQTKKVTFSEMMEGGIKDAIIASKNMKPLELNETDKKKIKDLDQIEESRITKSREDLFLRNKITEGIPFEKPITKQPFKEETKTVILSNGQGGEIKITEKGIEFKPLDRDELARRRITEGIPGSATEFESKSTPIVPLAGTELVEVQNQLTPHFAKGMLKGVQSVTPPPLELLKPIENPLSGIEKEILRITEGIPTVEEVLQEKNELKNKILEGIEGTLSKMEYDALKAIDSKELKSTILPDCSDEYKSHYKKK